MKVRGVEKAFEKSREGRNVYILIRVINCAFVGCNRTTGCQPVAAFPNRLAACCTILASLPEAQIMPVGGIPFSSSLREPVNLKLVQRSKGHKQTEAEVTGEAQSNGASDVF